jgi:hypothetical protein
MLGALLFLAAPVAVQVENLKAFTVLYGYVRFFHPSDEASRVDWEKLALLGVARVRDAESPGDLERALEGLFAPLAPTMRVFDEGDEPKAPLDLWPDFHEDLEVIAWQHKGVGLGHPGIYQSLRTNRLEGETVSGAGFGTIVQTVPAGPYRGKSVRLRAAAKTKVEGADNQGRLWLRVDRANGVVGFFDNMSDRPIRTESWRIFEIEGAVGEDANHLYFGGFLQGSGSVWLDAFELLVRGEDGTFSTIPMENPGFEGDSELAGWQAPNEPYRYAVEEAGCHEGRRCLLIASPPGNSPYQLFDALPEVGEVTAAALARRVRAQVPLALYGDSERTYGGRVDANAAEELKRALDSVTPSVLDERLSAVVIAWNVFQHFYPYFDVVDSDWDGALVRSLQETLGTPQEEDFRPVLQRLTAALHDGHVFVHRPEETARRAWLPIALDWIEGRVVLTRSEVSGFAAGDVVSSLDGEAAGAILERSEALISGSPQWKRYRALATLGSGPEGTTVEVAVTRDGEEIVRTLTRDRAALLTESRPESVSRIEEDIWYVDLTRAAFEEIRPRIDEMAAARGVVFDMRGYPKGGNEQVLRHLVDEPVHSAKWMVPRIVYPDRRDLAGYDTSGRWLLTPQSPRFRGKAVFLTHAGAISYGESLMGIVEHYRLGEIVGGPTAGANGNVNVFDLPGGYRVSWTGMRVVKHDDRQHHLVGILPTVPLERTLGAVREGRDEYLEKALSILR